jgi:rubrerythrin
MFTITDLRQIAVQIERNGESTYRKASQMVEDKKLTDLLIWMADEEAQHARWFEKLQAEYKDACEFPELGAMGRTLLQNMVENQTFSLDHTQLAKEHEVRGILIQSQEFENDTILFYDMLKNFLDDPIAIEHLELIISEEKGHLRKLRDMMADIDA